MEYYSAIKELNSRKLFCGYKQIILKLIKRDKRHRIPNKILKEKKTLDD